MRIAPYLFGVASIVFACGGVYLHDAASSEYRNTLMALKQDHEEAMGTIDREQLAVQYKLAKLNRESTSLKQQYEAAREQAFESLKKHLADKQERERKQQEAREQEERRKLDNERSRKKQQALIAQRFKEQSQHLINELKVKKQSLSTLVMARMGRLNRLPGEQADRTAENERLLNEAEFEINSRLTQELSTRYAKFSSNDRNVVKARQGAQQRILLLKQHYEAENLKLARQYQDEAASLKQEIEDLKEEIGQIDNSIANTEKNLYRVTEQPETNKTPEIDPFSLIPAPYFSKTPEFKNELEQVMALDPAFRKIHADYSIQSQVFQDMIPLAELNLRQLDMKRAGESRNYQGTVAIERERLEQRTSSIIHFSTTGAILSGLIFIICLLKDSMQSIRRVKKQT